MRKELLAVATAHRVTLYRLEDMGLAREIETLENPHGILAMVRQGCLTTDCTAQF